MTVVIDTCIYCDENHEVQPFSMGPKDADIVVVTNKRSSSTFQKALELELTQLGIDVGKVYFTPVIKCTEYETTLTNKQLKTHAADYLIPELQAVKPKFVLLLGNEALLAVSGKSGIMKWRGKELPNPVDAEYVMATISPSSVKRNPGQKGGFQADLRLFSSKVKGLATGVKVPKYLVVDSKEKLDKLGRILDMTDEIFIDVETTYREYYESDDVARMISLAATCIIVKPDGTKGVVGFAIPLSHPQSVWRNKWQAILRWIGRHVHNIRKVVAHNASFDCKWLISHGVRLYPTFDTMLAIHLLDENVGRGLKPQAMARLGVEAWGIDTGQLDKQPILDVLHYNFLDTYYMYLVKLQLVKELKDQPRLARIFLLETMPA